MLYPVILASITGWPAAALAIGASGAVAAAGYLLARRFKLAERLVPSYGFPPAPADRVTQLVACADHTSGYGIGVLPDFPACTRDPVLARAARLAADNPNPDELDAALDTDLQTWISLCAKRSEIVRRIESMLPIAGASGLLVGLLGAGAVAGGWFPAGTASALVLLGAILLGLVATALGSVRADHCAFADPAVVLDRQLISATMVALRRGKTAKEIENLLAGMLPSFQRTTEARARAA